MGNTICKDNIQLYSEAYHVGTYKASCPFAHNDGKWMSGTICRSVVSFTPWPLHLQGKSTWYPLNKRLVGPSTHVDILETRKTSLLSLPDIKPPFLDHPACTLVTIPTTPSWLICGCL